MTLEYYLDRPPPPPFYRIWPPLPDPWISLLNMYLFGHYWICFIYSLARPLLTYHGLSNRTGTVSSLYPSPSLPLMNFNNFQSSIRLLFRTLKKIFESIHGVVHFQFPGLYLLYERKVSDTAPYLL